MTGIEKKNRFFYGSAIILLTVGILLFLSLIVLPLDSKGYAGNLFLAILLSCSGGILLVHSLWLRSIKRVSLVLLVLGIVIRLAVAVQSKGTNDLIVWEKTADLVLGGGDFYAGGLTVTPPTWPWIVTAVKVASEALTLPFYFSARIPLLFADIGMLFMIAALSRISNCSEKEILTRKTLYFLNPLTVLVTTFHPTFSVMAFICLLAALYYSKRAKDEMSLPSSILLAVGTSIKQITAPALIPFFLYGGRTVWRYLMPFMTASLIGVLVLPYYLKFPDTVMTYLFGYMGPPSAFGIWGSLFDYNPSLYMAIMENKRIIVLLSILASTVSALYAFRKKLELSEAVQLSFIAFILVVPAWRVYYAFWLIPFGVLHRHVRMQYAIYSLLGSVTYLVLFGNQWLINPEVVYPAMFFVCIWWYVKILKPEKKQGMLDASPADMMTKV